MSLNTSNIIHIVAEVVTLLAITVYFMQQNRKMMDLIDSLTDKVEDQEEKIEKHDKVIADILKTMNKANSSGSASSSRPNSNLPIFTTTATAVSTLPSTTFLFDPKPSINLCFDNDCGEEEEEEEQDHEHEHDHEHDHEEEEAEQKHEVSKVEELDELIGLEFNDIHVDEEEKIQKVEEIIEIPIEDVKDTTNHTKKKRKKKKKTPSIAEIDKELEDELNDLYKEEIMNSH